MMMMMIFCTRMDELENVGLIFSLIEIYFKLKFYCVMTRKVLCDIVV